MRQLGNLNSHTLTPRAHPTPPAPVISARRPSRRAGGSGRRSIDAPQSGFGFSAHTAPRPALKQRQRPPTVRCQAAHDAYPFDEGDFHKVEFMTPPYGPMLLGQSKAGTPFQGVILFKRSDVRGVAPEDEKALEVFVSGDSALCVHNQLNNQPMQRPMALDLLWQILQRGKDVSKREWTLVRAAIVQLKDEVYHARLFFGDPVTKEIMWDCDCRPSDATYLTLQAKAPFFVHRKVWEASAQPVRETQCFAAIQYNKQHEERAAAGSKLVEVASAGAYNPEELDAIQLLVREMEVAVLEENYAEAARLRDHPYMRMAADVEMYTKIGYIDKARELFYTLKREIELNNAVVLEDHETRALEQQAPGHSGRQGAPAAGETEQARKESGQ